MNFFKQTLSTWTEERESRSQVDYSSVSLPLCSLKMYSHLIVNLWVAIEIMHRASKFAPSPAEKKIRIDDKKVLCEEKLYLHLG